MVYIVVALVYFAIIRDIHDVEISRISDKMIGIMFHLISLYTEKMLNN